MEHRLKVNSDIVYDCDIDDTDEIDDNHLRDDENHLSDEANVIYDDTEPTDVLLNLDDNVDTDENDDIEPETDLIFDTDKDTTDDIDVMIKDLRFDRYLFHQRM